MEKESRYKIDYFETRIISPTGKFLYAEGNQSFLGVVKFVEEINKLIEKKGKSE